METVCNTLDLLLNVVLLGLATSTMWKERIVPFSLSYSGIGLKIIVIMKLLLWQRIWKLLGVIILQYIGNTVNSFVFSLLILKKWKLNNMHIYFFYSIFNLSTFLFVKYCLKTVPVLIIYLIILLPAFLAVVNSAVMNSYVGKAWSGFLCVWVFFCFVFLNIYISRREFRM